MKSAQIAQAVARSSQGLSQEQIASEMGVSRTTVQRWLASQEAVALVEDSVASAREVLSEGARRAAEKLVELLDYDDEKPGPVQLGAAKTILDRIGVIPGSKVEHGGDFNGTNAELAERLREVLEALDDE